MNREIKFRAWDKQRKCFIGYTEFAGMINPTDGGGKTTQLRYTDSILLMQYTGLKDKNGKEIYEGDIVIYLGHFPRIVIWMPKGHYAGWFASKLEDGTPYNSIDNLPIGETNEANQIEVIGNIYETKDLLT